MNLLDYFSVFLANDALADILDQPRYEGAMDAIRGVTRVVDTGFTAFITFIAFFIISVAMLRNVLAGAYVAYPKFWDKVADAHAEKADKAYFESIKGFFTSDWQKTSNTSISNFVLGILPNVKAWSDFADSEASDKDLKASEYFMKAIPKMIAIIIIGVFIYNGYYRDTAMLITGTGATFFERLVTSVDPVELIDRVAETSGTPEFASDDALTKKDKLINTISKEIYKKILTKYNDVTGPEAKAALASSIESQVETAVNDKCADYADDPTWIPKVSVTLAKTSLDRGKTTNSDGTVVAIPINSWSVTDFDFESTKAVGESWYVNASVVFNRDYQATNSVAYIPKVTVNLHAETVNNELKFRGITAKELKQLGFKAKALLGTSSISKVYDGEGDKAGFAYVELDGAFTSGQELKRPRNVVVGNVQLEVEHVIVTHSNDGKHTWESPKYKETSEKPRPYPETDVIDTSQWELIK